MYVSTDCMMAAAGYVSREFVYGTRLRVVSAGFVNALFELCAGDGARRLLLVDRHGNVELGRPDDLEATDDYGAWSMAAADRLYARRNGYAIENVCSEL
jgi:hypothetical protein